LRLVFDTNVIVAGLVSEGLCHELVESHLPDHSAILSRFLWDELVERLRDKFGLNADDLPLLDLYRRHATWVEPEALATPVCRDPDDDWVLATAVAGEAEAVVTGDGDLLDLAAYRGVSILSPRQFIERLGGPPRERRARRR
jgi:putative PIN family toxin of toxin-antitoxin system